MPAEQCRQRSRRRKTGTAMAEFGPAMWIFFVLIVFPLIDLASFLAGVSSVMLVANMGARQAAPCGTYTDAVNSVKTTYDNLKMFRDFAKMSPSVSGAPPLDNTGTNISCVVTETSSGKQQVYHKGDKVPNDSQSLADNIYQYQVTSSYNVSPLFNFNGIPVLGDVPGLGAPVPVEFTATAAVEHPEGLNN